MPHSATWPAPEGYVHEHVYAEARASAPGVWTEPGASLIYRDAELAVQVGVAGSLVVAGSPRTAITTASGTKMPSRVRQVSRGRDELDRANSLGNKLAGPFARFDQ